MKAYDFFAFKRKYGISLTDKPKSDIQDPALINELEDLYYASQETPRLAIPRIIKMMSLLPEDTSLNNHLFVAYTKSGQEKKAKEVLENTLKQHPDYLFGPVNYLLFNPTEKWVLAHGPKLGKNLDIHDWPAEIDGKYHFTEFEAFEKAAILYLIYQDKLDEAKDRLNRLLDLGVQEEAIGFHLNAYQKQLITGFTQRRVRTEARMISPPVISSVDIDALSREFKLSHPELDVLIDLNLEEMDEEMLNSILALPRPTLIADLRLLLRQAFIHYAECDGNDGDNWFQQPIHALYILGALEASEALPDVLDMLRIGEHFLDFFTGDYPDIYFQPAFFALAKKETEQLAKYLREPHNFYMDRSLVAETLAQIGLHFPGQRDRVIEIFRDLWEYMLANPTDRTFLDTNFLSATINDVIDLRATSLLPLIRQFFERGWIDENHAGDLLAVEKEIVLPPDKACIAPQPLTPFEYYNKAYRKRRAKPNNQIPLEQLDTPLDLILRERMIRQMSKNNTPLNQFFSEQLPAGLSNPVVHATPKVGRNEPCPCGSGKKYKQCCLKK